MEKSCRRCSRFQLRRHSWFLQRHTRALKPLCKHSLHVIGGTLAVVFASPFATEDEFLEAWEVGRGPGVVVPGDS